jgi:pentatricopeptide repeat protein
MYSKSKTDDAPQKAEQVVNRFRSLSASGVLNVCPDEYTYSLLLKTWYVCYRHFDSFTYSTYTRLFIINIRVTSTRRDGIDQAVSCLQWMRELSQSGDLAATPDIVKYTTIISAYARSGMFQQAGDLLSKMIEDFKSGNDLAKPDYKAFDIVIAACCGWNHVTSFGRCNGQLAEHFLHQMWELHQSDKVDDLRPKASMYKSVIICYKKSRDAEQAERVLQDMDFLYKAGRLDAGPSKKLFQTVVNAWHESFRMDKQSRLQKVRMEMNERFGRNPIESKFPFDSYFHE